ncbi:hypothetical protein ACFVXC_05455 [Streptomyces sp. NPDC058257]|uniref:hypothetical protein n=1 Tax=Streptomyces sp. NPDC058257 TaxID=3346409 RepID=UPI0036EF747A
MTELKTTDAVPEGGWLTDLDDKELKSLVGATLSVFCNLRSNTGLLVKVEDGTAYLFRPDQGEFLEYPVSATRFERTPGTPMRPALAAALVYEREWCAFAASLEDAEGQITDQGKWDHGRGDYEYGMPDRFESLLMELTTQLFPSPETALNTTAGTAAEGTR